MKNTNITPEKKQPYDVLTDTRLPVNVRGRIAYEGFKGSIDTLKELKAAQLQWASIL